MLLIIATTIDNEVLRWTAVLRGLDFDTIKFNDSFPLRWHRYLAFLFLLVVMASFFNFLNPLGTNLLNTFRTIDLCLFISVFHLWVMHYYFRALWKLHRPKFTFHAPSSNVCYFYFYVNFFPRLLHFIPSAFGKFCLVISLYSFFLLLFVSIFL